MSNPFDDDEATFIVLVNDENEHSLWPQAQAVPDGWRIAHGPAPRSACLAWIEETWTDLRPASLQRHAESAGR